jgi:hypothetical protein
VDRRALNLWYELQEIASSIEFLDESDSIIWKFISSGKYSVKSLYAVVNDRGVRQIFSLVVWKIIVPPRIHISLWLVTNIKILTRDNMSKRESLDDMSCLFWSEAESVNHLFFSCGVAKCAWEALSEVMKIRIGLDFESVAKLWMQNKKYTFVNMCTVALLWTL